MLRRVSGHVMRGVRAASGAPASAAAPSSSFNGIIPPEALEKRFSLSSGPGGQNVQKNATKCEIRFKLADADWLSQELKTALSARLSNRINQAGELIIASDRTRERSLNLADCVDKLRSTIYAVEEEMQNRETTEEDSALLARRAAVAAQKRLAEKRRLQHKKQMRSGDF